MSIPKVFVIMPFDDPFFEVYDFLKKQFEEEFEFSNAGDKDNQQNILKDIIQPIFEADIILADLTGLNPNVLYELGVAHSFNKKTIVITQKDLDNLPFDLKQYRAKEYNTHFTKFAELVEYLRKNLNGAITGNVVFSNPVKDFVNTQEGINVSDLFSQDKIKIEIGEGEKGFLDFLADIEEDTVVLTQSLENLTKDMILMSEGMNKSTSEIERVNQNGGDSVATFVRKEARKVANHINEYDKKQKGFNNDYTALWDKIEKNILGLLENKFSTIDNNKESLIEYLFALHNMQISVVDCIEQTKGLKTSLGSSMGLERTLNQAIRCLDEDLATYLNNMSRVDTAIDKIKEKSRFVVGQIDFTEKQTEIIKF